MVTGTYKDFNPIQFELEVDYLANLDGKSKFVDLGSHVFYKNTTLKKSLSVQVVDAIDTDNEMEFDSFKLTLNDGLKDYYNLEDQSSESTIQYNKVDDVPRLGENIITASGSGYYESHRRFPWLPY
jgi:hypothetical protein